MKATAKDLRFHTKRLLEAVERGEEVVITYRGEPRARLVPVDSARRKRPPRARLFGIWGDREDVEDVASYLDGLRESRF
jgi:prevent-host-death family protein